MEKKEKTKKISTYGTRHSERLNNKRQMSNPAINPKKQQKPKKDTYNNIYKEISNDDKEEDASSPGKESKPKVAPEEDFAEWLRETNQTVQQILEKNIKIEKGYKGYSKENYTKIQGILKEVRLAGKYISENIERLKDELKEKQEEKTASDAVNAEKLETLQKQLEERKNKVEDCQKNVVFFKNSENNLRDFHAKLISKAKEAEMEYKNLRNNFFNLKEKYHIFQSEVIELKQEIRLLNESNDMKVEAINERINYLERCNQEETTRNNVLKKEFEKSLEHFTKLEEINQKLLEENQKYLKMTGKHEEELDMAEEEHGSLKNHNDEEMKKAEDLRKELALSDQANELAKAEIKEKESIILKLQVQNTNLELNKKANDEEIKKNQQAIRKQQNILQGLQGNIRVFCRVRPKQINEEDIEPMSQEKIISYPSRQKGFNVIGRENAITILSKTSKSQSFESFTFTFDKIFKENTTQDIVFEETSEIIKSVLEGHKVCIFAYGETKSGKTYTLLGNEMDKGVIPRALEMIYDQSKNLENLGWQYIINVALIKIYNEECYDMLNDDVSDKKHVAIHGNINDISDMTWLNICDDENEIFEKTILKKLTNSKLMEFKSHLVFIVKIEGVNTNMNKKVKGILNLVDLASSDEFKEIDPSIHKFKEVQNINKSLSSLGDVIMALSNNSDQVPYDSSKLTWLLKPCFGGVNSKMLFIVNISGNKDCSEESLRTLRFAAKINACQIGSKFKAAQLSSKKD